MNDVDLLMDAFGAGKLLRPSSDVPNIVDLSNAVASLIGAKDARKTPGSDSIEKLIGESDHLIFVLVDGFGMNFVETMEEGSFAREYIAAELLTVFPTSTPVVLTTLATGSWPSQHAIPGWDVLIPEQEVVSTIIRYFRRSDEVGLSQLGVSPEEAFPDHSNFSDIEVDSLALFPDYIASSEYSNFSFGKNNQSGYKRIKKAIDFVINRIEESDHQTFTYLYIPFLDSNAHEFGTAHKNTQACLRKVDNDLARLASKLPDNSRLIVTADHGLIDASKTHIIEKSDQLMSHLNSEPFGDSRAAYFNVKCNSLSVFVRDFKKRFGDSFALLSIEDLETLGLMGPDAVDARTKSRMGNVIAIAMEKEALYGRFAMKTKAPMVGYHGGLSPGEMRIPLVIA